MRRILHVVGDSKFGGGGVLILDLVEGAAAEGFDVSVLTTDPVFKEKLGERGLQNIDIDVIRRPIRPLWDLGGLWRLWRFLRRNRFDLIHTHTSKAGFVGRLAARFARVPVIVHTVHGFAFHDESRSIERFVYVWLERLAAFACDLIVTVSEHHLTEAAKLRIGRSGRIRAIPNGIKPERVGPSRTRELVRADLGLEPTVVALMTIGRLAEQKGLEYLLRAVAALDRELPPFRFLLAGDGPLRESLERTVVELRIGDLVEFLGFRNDVGDLLEAADIVVMPSLWEGLSISLLEALAARKPVVTTSIPSNVEVTANGSCAVLVPVRDAERLAGEITRLLLEPQSREALAESALERFESQYTSARMVDSYLAEYRRLLEGSASQPAPRKSSTP